MKVTPRRDEVKAVVELLESTDYDSADALAKDVIKRVGELFAEREWWAYAWRSGPGGLVLSWGPLSSENEVKKFATKLSVAGEHLAVKLYSTAGKLAALEAMDKPRELHCVGCNHPLELHEHKGYRGRCAIDACGCTKAVKTT